MISKCSTHTHYYFELFCHILNNQLKKQEKVLITTSKLSFPENNNDNEEEEEENGNKKNIEYKDNTQNWCKEEFHILSGIIDIKYVKEMLIFLPSFVSSSLRTYLGLLWIEFNIPLLIRSNIILCTCKIEKKVLNKECILFW